MELIIKVIVGVLVVMWVITEVSRFRRRIHRPRVGQIWQCKHAARRAKVIGREDSTGAVVCSISNGLQKEVVEVLSPDTFDREYVQIKVVAHAHHN